MTRGRKSSRNSSGSTGRGNGSTANTLLRQGREALSGAYDQARSTGRSIRRMGSDIDLGASRRSVAHMIEDNPLVLGAVGLGIGMVIGAMMPSVDMRSVRGMGRSMGLDMSSSNRGGSRRGRGKRS